jgi:Capsule polysaccharide biosynthesis protein
VTLDELTERLFSIEKRLELFSDRSGGLPWWDAVRYHVHEFLFAGLTGAVPALPVHRALPARALGWAQRTALRMLLNFRIAFFRYDTLILRAPRHKDKGRRMDPGLDDVLALCPGRALTIDTFPHYFHLPRRSSRRREVYPGEPIDRLLEVLISEFGGSWDQSALRELIAARLRDFQSAMDAYRKLLARIRPRLIVMTQNGIEKALFAAAREARIPLVEAQHGLIGHSHPAYSYPREADYGDHGTFPTVFLAFSEHWLRACFYPADRCVSIGNNHFAIGALPPPTDPGAVMFVSGELYHEVLREWAMRLAAANPRRKIIYKLHPNQHSASRKIEQELSAIENIEVIDASVSARALLPRVGHVVLIQSTVTLEALQTGRRVCILPFFHYQIHKDLFECAAVSVTPTLEDLIRALDAPADCAPPPSFFDRFDAAAASELLRELYDIADIASRPA